MAKQRKHPPIRQDYDKVVHAWLENKDLLSLQDYLTRGRQLQSVDSEQLKGDWLKLVRRWAEQPETPPGVRRDDIEAELRLRGDLLPYDDVRFELENITTAATKSMDQLKHDDPQEFEKRNQSLQIELEGFIREGKAKLN
jgi:hypothetical protein